MLEVIPAQLDLLRLQAVVRGDFDQLPHGDFTLADRIIVQKPPDVQRNIVMPSDRSQSEQRAVLAVVHRLKQPENQNRAGQFFDELRLRHTDHRAAAPDQRIEEGHRILLDLRQIHGADPVPVLKLNQGRARIGVGQLRDIVVRLRLELEARSQLQQPLDRISVELLLELGREKRVEIDVAL